MPKVLLAVLGLWLLATSVVYAQGDGIGGVLVRDVAIPNDEDEWPKVLPVGGLVAFGSGRDWAAAIRDNGMVLVHFIIKEEDGDLDRGYAKIPEEAVRIFNWACGEPKETPLNKRRLVLCSPFVGSYDARSTEWQLRFVSEARKAAQGLGVSLVEAVSATYKGGAVAPNTGASGVAGAPSSGCSVDQILKMKEAGLSDAQIKAACGG